MIRRKDYGYLNIVNHKIYDIILASNELIKCYVFEICLLYKTYIVIDRKISQFSLCGFLLEQFLLIHLCNLHIRNGLILLFNFFIKIR